MTTSRAAALVACAALLASASRATAGGDAPVRPYAVGDTVEDFTLKDLYGGSFSLAAARKIDDAAAWAAVAAAARESGAILDVKPKDERALDALPGLKGADGKPDAAKRTAFCRAAGKAFGLLPSEKTVAGWKGLADVAGWISKSAEAPIVVFCWYSGCPTSKAYEDRLQALAETTGARFFALATNYHEEDATIRGYVDGKPFPFRVLDDRELKVSDRLGGRRTPHCFVLDAKNVLRYAGAVDDDAMEEKAEAARARWLGDALAAVGEGHTPAVLQTTPVG